tara:strand:+ start:3765 stop:4745 length:981 start_codon:yes stop_codon:yes gene_type:complete
MKYLQSKIIISLLIIIPILILYFNLNPKDLLTFNKIKENYDNNYTNICKNKDTYFYDININNNNSIKTYELTNDKKNNCKFKCSEDKCDLYTLKDLDNDKVQCYTYNLDGGNQLNSVKVNCNNNKLSNSLSRLFDKFDGKGFVNKDFYKSNKDKFEYLDYQLEESNSIISKYHSINNEINRLNNTSESRNKLIQLYDDVNLESKELADNLDLSKNMIYSNFVPNDYSVDINANFKLGDKNLNYDDMIKYVNDVNLENKFYNNKKNNVKDNFEYKFAFYLALSIILIISIIILILYKISNNISETFLIIYFIIVSISLLLIHYIFKI